MFKIKYTWELMHGDGDHYDNKSLTLTDENDIKFFDYVIDLGFDNYDCKGLLFEKYDENDDVIEDEEDENKKQILINLFKNSKIYKEDYEQYNDSKDINNIFGYINDYLSDINYIESDVTCDGWHYANIRDIDRKEIIDKPKDKNVYVVFDNTDIIEIFKSKKKAEKFIKDTNYIIKSIELK